MDRNDRLVLAAALLYAGHKGTVGACATLALALEVAVNKVIYNEGKTSEEKIT